jgi:hypothetical protein
MSNCTAAQQPTYSLSSGSLYCKDDASRCPALFPSSCSGARWNVSSSTHLCVLACPQVQVTCPTGYASVCGVTCVCVSQGESGGTLTAGSNATPPTGGAVITTVSDRQAQPGAPCYNDVECFFTDRLPYALGVTAVIACLLVLLAWVIKRFTCPTRRLCPRLSCSICKGRGPATPQPPAASSMAPRRNKPIKPKARGRSRKRAALRAARDPAPHSHPQWKRNPLAAASSAEEEIV